MLSIQAILVALFSGFFIGGAWWVFVDGIVYAPDAFPWVHILPPLAGSITFVCLNMTTFQSMKEYAAARVWVFVFLVLGCVAIGGGIWITAVEYPPDISQNYPGVAIILNTVMLFFASILFFAGRSIWVEDKYQF